MIQCSMLLSFLVVYYILVPLDRLGLIKLISGNINTSVWFKLRVVDNLNIEVIYPQETSTNMKRPKLGRVVEKS